MNALSVSTLEGKSLGVLINDPSHEKLIIVKGPGCSNEVINNIKSEWGNRVEIVNAWFRTDYPNIGIDKCPLCEHFYRGNKSIWGDPINLPIGTLTVCSRCSAPLQSKGNGAIKYISDEEIEKLGSNAISFIKNRQEDVMGGKQGVFGGERNICK